MEHFVRPPIGPGNRDGIGSEARFSSPESIWADAENVYIADGGNAVIRKLTIATGQVTTVVGQQHGTFSRLGEIWGDGSSLYVTDYGVVRKVDPRTGSVSTFVDQWYPESLPCCPFILPSPIALTGNSKHLYVLNEIPGTSDLPTDFRGVLRVSADVPISVVGMRGQYNERGEFLIATTPALAEDSMAATTESIFPHIVGGSGYTTEFLLLAGGGANGTVDFISQSDKSLPLPIQH